MKKQNISIFLIGIFIFIFPYSTLIASLPVILEKEQEIYPLSLHLEYLEDPPAGLSIEDVSSPEFETKFVSNQNEVLTLGITSPTYWVRFQLQVPLNNQEKWLLEIKGNDWNLIQIYIPSRTKSWYREEGGRGLPMDPSIFINNNTVFRLPYPLLQNQIIYLRFEAKIDRFLADNDMSLNIQLRSGKNHQESVAWGIYLRGLFHGLLIIMVVYNLFLFISIRDQSYLFYTIYISALIALFMLIDGVGIQFFWQKPVVILRKTQVFWFCIFESFFILFVKSFLLTKQNTPKSDKILTFLMISCIVAGLFILLLPGFSEFAGNILVISSLIMLVTTIFVGILCVKKGYKPAQYFLLAGSSFVGGTAISALESLQLIPLSEDAAFWFMKSGTLLEAVLYSFALADRFKYERKLKEESQQKALKNLQKADRIKDEFLANTSHELRTPLNGIIGLAEATINNLENESPQKIHSNLSLVISSGRRLSLLVNDILDFSKLKHKEIPLNRRPILLHRVIESVLALSQTSINHKPIQLINQVNKNSTPFVLADEARLEQILYNLISNAIKFTQEGSVTISAQLKDQQVTISISDTGIGIPKAAQTNIFNAFEQVDGKETRQYEGTGLGLTIVKQLVELHESKLTLESEENQGSVFSFSLPITEASDSIITIDSKLQKPYQVIEPQKVVSLKATSPLTGFLDILIVDDDPLNIDVICQQLNSTHYSLRVARDGSQALQMVKHKKPDLILLDVMMPEISGFEVCKQLRKQYHQNHLPIIFLTAKNREADVIRGLEIGGNDYLTKPFFRTELIQRVETHLENMLYQNQSDALNTLSNKISQYASREEVMQEAFEQIAHWSLVDEAGLFQGDELLFHNKPDAAIGKKILKSPTQTLLKEINIDLQNPQIIIANSVDQNHPIGQFYQPGHFLFVCPQHLPNHLLIFYRNLERKPFDKSKAAFYVQSMMNQIQTTQSNLESLFEDNYLVSVIGQVQPRLSEITHVKSSSPTLELYFDSDKRTEFIDGCSLEKLSLYFKESLLMRTHKSYLVNVSKVVALQKASKSRLLKMELTSGEIIPVGKTYMGKTRQVFAELLH
jgi:two-component system, sensor histidine kinase LadS